MIPAGGNRFYALTQDNKLVWYQHDGFNDGTFRWKPASEVGSGWGAFKDIFSTGKCYLRGKAREAAQKCIVLLKNEGNVLPLKGIQDITVFGRLADLP